MRKVKEVFSAFLLILILIVPVYASTDYSTISYNFSGDKLDGKANGILYSLEDGAVRLTSYSKITETKANDNMNYSQVEYDVQLWVPNNWGIERNLATITQIANTSTTENGAIWRAEGVKGKKGYLIFQKNKKYRGVRIEGYGTLTTGVK